MVLISFFHDTLVSPSFFSKFHLPSSHLVDSQSRPPEKLIVTSKLFVFKLEFYKMIFIGFSLVWARFFVQFSWKKMVQGEHILHRYFLSHVQIAAGVVARSHDCLFLLFPSVGFPSHFRVNSVWLIYLTSRPTFVRKQQFSHQPSMIFSDGCHELSLS